MKNLRIAFYALMLLGPAYFFADPLQAEDTNSLSGAAALLPQHQASGVTGPTYTLDKLEQMALAGNPEIRVAAEHLSLVEAHIPSAGALDDPMFMYRGWQVPLSQPWNYNAAQNMFMVRSPGEITPNSTDFAGQISIRQVIQAGKESAHGPATGRREVGRRRQR